MKVKRPFRVETGNCTSWHETIEEATKDFDKWCDFYNNNKGYGNRTITLTKNYIGSKDYKVIKSSPINEQTA